MAFLKGFPILMGANVALLVLSFFNNKIIYMFLDRESNGVYFLAMRLTLFTALLCGDWLRLSAFNIAGRDRNLRSKLAANAFWYCMLLGIVIALPATLLFPSFASAVFGIPPACIAVAAFAASFSILRDTSQSLLLVDKRVERYSFTFIVLGGVFLCSDIVLLVIFGFGLNAVLVSWIAAIVFSTLWAFLNIVAEKNFSLRPSLHVLSKSREIGSRALIAVAGMFLMMNVHTFTIEPIARNLGNGLVLVALYSVCFRILQLFQRVADVTGSLLLSHVVTDDRHAGFMMTARAARGVFMFSSITALVVLFTGKYLVLLVADAKYVEAARPLLLMLPGMIAVTTGSVLNNVYWGNGYPFRVILGPFGAAALGLALDLLLVPSMGVGGATLAFSISCALWAMWIAGRFCRDSGMSPKEVFIPKKEEILQVQALILNRLRRGVS